MKSILFIITLLFSVSTISQNESFVLDLTKDSDTLFWKKIQKEKIEEFKLPELNRDMEFVFRKWNPGNVLEIVKNGNDISAKIIYFVFEVWNNNYKADTFVKEYRIPNKSAKSLYEYIKSSGIDKIPSDKYITGWQQGFDGITHIYEIKDKNKYSFKNYWTPKVQKEIKEAKFIIELNEKIREIGKLTKYGEKFIKEVPFPNYMYSGQHYSIMKLLTKKELRKYKRKRKLKNKR